MTNGKLMISIIDDKGSRQFSIHKVMKKVLIYGAVMALGLTITYIVAMKFLVSELDKLVEQKNLARDKFQEIYEKNNELVRSIEYKTDELLKANNKIGELESIVGMQKNSDSEIQAYAIDLAQLSHAQKQIVLNVVPNGNPVKNYDWENAQPQKSHTAVYAVPKGTPVYATANGVVNSVARGTRYGNTLSIVHSFGFTSLYGSIDNLVVSTGEFVAKGQLLGYSSRHSGKDELLYELKFLGNALDTHNFAQWNIYNFENIAQSSESVNWSSLIWALDDLAQLQFYRTASGSVDSSGGVDGL